MGGFAYLTKGSISPMLARVCRREFAALRVGTSFSAKRRGFVLSDTNLWHWRNHLVGLVVLGAAHLMTVGPRLSYAQEQYGDPFHSYPAYWMWMDSFGGPPTVNDPKTCYGWMAKHSSRDELVAMLPSERPSFSNYMRTHTREERRTPLGRYDEPEEQGNRHHRSRA